MPLMLLLLLLLLLLLMLLLKQMNKLLFLVALPSHPLTKQSDTIASGA
jgi:hypothetical protein